MRYMQFPTLTKAKGEGVNAYIILPPQLHLFTAHCSWRFVHLSLQAGTRRTLQDADSKSNFDHEAKCRNLLSERLITQQRGDVSPRTQAKMASRWGPPRAPGTSVRITNSNRTSGTVGPEIHPEQKAKADFSTKSSDYLRPGCRVLLSRGSGVHGGATKDITEADNYSEPPLPTADKPHLHQLPWRGILHTLF